MEVKTEKPAKEKKERTPAQIAAAEKLAAAAKERAEKKAADKKNSPPPTDVIEPANPVIEAIEEVIQHLENALTGMLLAKAKLREQDGSLDRVVRSEQRIGEILRDIKPYLEG